MIYISKDRQIHVVWSIFRGTSDVHEDFSRALVKVFLIGNYEKYLLEAVAEGGNLVFDIPQGLPEGAYSLEAIWVKNYNNLLPCSDTLTPSVDSGCRNQPLRWPFKHPHDHRFNDRCIMRSRKDFVFALTEYDSESTFYKDSGEAEIKIRSAVATYGYDGLSAYEIAVLRGDFNGTEGEYLDSLKFKLEVAQEHKLGGITAVTKTDDETEEVKVDPETGRLYVKPGGGALSVATETKLGGIKAATKTSLETQEVKIDPVTGKLYTQPGGEGGVEIVNNPDEEDLHSIEKSTDVHVLQFADKEYNASSFSGLGRVYLRKNISSGKNVLTQAMMSKSNTRYVIQYDYDLDGETITVPEGCTLEFQGGKIKNGTINFDDSSIISEDKIFENIDYSGRVINSINVKWFGAVGDGTTDDTEAFLKALRSYQDYDYVYLTKNAGNTIYVPRGSYRISQTLYLRKGCVLKGDGSGNTFIDYYKAKGYAINMGNKPPEEGDDDHPNGTNDPGGLQPIVQDLFLTSTLGGNGIFVNVAGFKILDCWFTCGTSITASGVDGIISRCVNDNGAVFLKLDTVNIGVTDYDKTHTIAVSDCITYACTYCALWLNGLYGVTISNCSFYYSRNHTVLIESDTGNVQFSNCDFRMSLAEGYYNEDSCNFYSVNGGLYDSTIVGCTFSCAQQYDILFSKWKDTLISDCIFKDSNNTSLYITNSSGIHVHGCTFIRIKNSPIWVYSPAYLDENIFKDCNADSKIDEWDNACIRVNGENSSNSIIRNNICNNENYVSSFTTSTINNIVHGNRSLGKSRDSYVYTTSGGIFENERTSSFSNEAKCHLGGTQYAPTLTSTDGGFNYHNTEKHISLIWDSKSWRNPDFTNPNKVDIHNYVYDDIESIQNDFNNIGNNAIHKIVSDIDLKGGTLQINMGCTLIFDGGSISNGTLQLTGTKILPMGVDITKYVSANISGTYEEGQILYDSSLKKMKLYNGTEWVNLDGTALQ